MQYGHRPVSKDFFKHHVSSVLKVFCWSYYEKKCAWSWNDFLFEWNICPVPSSSCSRSSSCYPPSVLIMLVIRLFWVELTRQPPTQILNTIQNVFVSFWLFFCLFVYSSNVCLSTFIVCPGSSDPLEKIFNIFAPENEVYTRGNTVCPVSS